MAENPFNRINWVDVIAVILFARMGYIGLRLGLGGELVKLAGLAVGFFAGFRYYQGLGDILSRRAHLGVEWAAALALVGLVTAVYWVVTWGLRALEPLVQVSFHDRLNQFGGLLGGFFRGALVCSVVLVICQQLPSAYLHASIEERSLSGRFLSRMAPAVYDGVSALGTRLYGAFSGSG